MRATIAQASLFFFGCLWAVFAVWLNNETAFIVSNGFIAASLVLWGLGEEED